ncbi:hypothetical protein CLAFUW4_08663 [Fulvia fulva]|nr:hypothetical protein CLAFUR4_08665 [Fulvia fulva]WPV12088.1 hypothetical protein CLAFUW4_08663 [Fulvia fulva]WPV27016.1 hypothetical protein CLAFUW7_08660 [Fulvia fulva]
MEPEQPIGGCHQNSPRLRHHEEFRRRVVELLAWHQKSIDSFCEDQSSGKIKGCEPPLSDYRATARFYSNTSMLRDTFDLTMDFNVQMCLDAPRDLGINLDLGGIGMLVSYVSQVSAVLAICLIWHCLNDWAHMTARTFYRIRKRSVDHSKAARDFQQRLIDSRYYASFIKLLAEFQKAQVFFISAVEVAALIALHDPSKLADDSSGETPDSPGATNALLNNTDIFVNLAFAGTLPIVLCLLVLRLAGKKDSYTVAITTCPIALALPYGVLLAASSIEAVFPISSRVAVHESVRM